MLSGCWLLPDFSSTPVKIHHKEFICCWNCSCYRKCLLFSQFPKHELLQQLNKQSLPTAEKCIHCADGRGSGNVGKIGGFSLGFSTKTFRNQEVILDVTVLIPLKGLRTCFLFNYIWTIDKVNFWSQNNYSARLLNGHSYSDITPTEVNLESSASIAKNKKTQNSQ